MKNIHILLFAFLFLSNIINVLNSSLKKKSNHMNIKNETNNTYRKRNKRSKSIFSKRKLKDFKAPKKKLQESTVFPKLKILIDKAELFETCPYEEVYKNNIYTAMQNAQKILEELIRIDIDTSAYIYVITDDEKNIIQSEYGMSHSSSFLNNDFILGDNYNFFIFGKFIDTLNVDTTSYLLEEYGTPVFGVIYFNMNIDRSKLTVEYLTPLMLHHFIRLLGFNDQYILSTTLTIGNYPNLIEYARNYFNCPNIESIELTEETEGSFLFPDAKKITEFTGLYWPKRILLGELMTKFDYPEEQVLSGFTLALLEDLGYIQVTKKYTGGLMRFGKHKGCEFFYDCDDTSVPSFTFDNEFFLPSVEPTDSVPSCSSGRLSKTAYKLQTISSGVSGDEEVTPAEVEYPGLSVEDGISTGGITVGGEKTEYNLNGKGGLDSTNYCPVAQYDTTYYGNCFETNTNLNTNRHEVIGSNSFVLDLKMNIPRN